MEFNYFDVIVLTIILFLGLKGIINGFFKELFGLIGIIGGIFLASRVGDSIGQKISDLIFKFENSAAINFTGFLVTLAIFWMLMILVGMIFKKLSSMSALGIFDKLLGFLFSASKFFLIAAVIAHASYNIKAIKTNVDSMMSTSMMFPILVETGSYIMKLDTTDTVAAMDEVIEKNSQAIKDSVEESVKESTMQIVEETKKKITKQLEENLSNEGNR